MSGSVVLLSGGQDSTICLGWALREFGRPLVALSFDYGQRHRKELQSARLVARRIGADDHRTIRLDFGGSIPSGLTEPRVEVAASGGIDDLPTTYVPGRNAVFLSLAAGVAQVRGIENVVIGCSQVDYSGYPDCRESFLTRMRSTLQIGLAFSALQIHAPLLHRAKSAALIHLACPFDDVWASLALSWTCYFGRTEPCGDCPSCKLRIESFKEAGCQDPAMSLRPGPT